MLGFGPSVRCLNALFGVHCSQVIRALMAWVEIILLRALYAHGVVGGCIIDAVRIGSIGSCVNTTCWNTGSLILAINGTVPGVLLRVWR